MAPPLGDDARIQVLTAKLRGLLNGVFHTPHVPILIGFPSLGNIICESVVAVFLSLSRVFDSG